ncbi:MAG: hypothetical protein NVSMB23_12120 [Myxococcales bacterium]
MPPPQETEAVRAAEDPLGGLAPQPAPATGPGGGRIDLLLREGERARAQLDAALARARARALRLALLQMAALLACALAVALCGGALVGSVASALLARISAALLFAAGLAALVAFVRRAPLPRAALASRDPRALARLLSAPEGGGGLEILSSVELSRSGPDGTSRELLSLLHLRAAARASAVDLRRVLPIRSLRGPAGALACALLAVAAASALAPRQLSLGLRRLWGGEAAQPLAELSPIAFDLSLTYLYPQYTGLAPRVEQGTAGDLRGPRGTQVRLTARADRDLDRAYAVVNGATVPLGAEGPGHRALSGTILLSAAGTWHLRFTDAKGRSIAEGPTRPVEIQADQPPQAQIDDPRQLELEVDPQGKVALSWSASDDYGLSRVQLVFQRAGEPEARVELTPPPAEGAAARRLRGTWAWEMAPLRLRAGDKVSYFVEAKDNDAVDGPQRGVSQTHVLKVFSAAEHHKDALIKATQLWERLVALLADRLEEKQVPGRDAAGALAWYGPLAQKDRDALALVSEMGKTGRELLKDKLAPRPVARALRYVQSSLGPFVQRTSIARAPLSRGAAAREGSVRLFGVALANEVREEEKDVLYLADLLDKARLDDLQEVSRELARSRRELARLAERLRKAPDAAAKKELLAEVQRLRERVQELMQRMAEMAKGIRDEHLNEEAVEAVQKEQDLMSKLSDIQRKLQGGEIDAALKDLDKLSAQLEQLEKGLQDKANARSGREYAEEGRQLKEAAAQMARLKERERALEQRTQKLRRSARADAEKRFAEKGGKELAQKLLGKVAQAKKALQEVDPRVASGLGMEESLEAAEGRVSDLSRALAAGDYDEALDQVQRGLRAVDSLQARLSIEDQFSRRSPGFARDPAAVRRALKGVSGAVGPLSEVLAQLRDALPREGQDASPEAQRELRAQQAEQRAIKEGMQGVREKLSGVGKKMPIFGPAHEQMLQEAQDGMAQAEERLGQGEPRSAQAGEAQALEKLSQFEKAMQEMAKGGKGGGGSPMPMPWGEPQGAGDEQGDDPGEDGAGSKERVEIPDAESSRGPQQFRKNLLDAMKQKAPDKYQERVKQYYEELVK